MIKKIKDILFYFFIGFILCYIAIAYLNPLKLTNVFGFQLLTVLSDSMDPIIEPNDLIIITHADQDELHVGDIITFQVYIYEEEKISFVTHFIADIQEVDGTTYYYTKDNQSNDDSFDVWLNQDQETINLTYEQIAGVYTYRIKGVGQLTTILRNPIAFIGVFAIGGIVYLFVKND